MLAGTYNIEMEQGATYLEVFEWRDSSNVLINLTGFTAAMQARSSYASATKLLDMTTANGQIILGGAAGTITLTLPVSVTTAITWTTALYDLLLIEPGVNGKTYRLLEGTITVDLGVTR